MKINMILLFILCIFITTPLTARQNAKYPPDEETTQGLILLDYEIISLPQNRSIDLLGTHYLHKINDWLYFGFGMHAPLVKGDYGGFMTLDATLHLQYTLINNTFFCYPTLIRRSGFSPGNPLV